MDKDGETLDGGIRLKSPMGWQQFVAECEEATAISLQDLKPGFEAAFPYADLSLSIHNNRIAVEMAHKDRPLGRIYLRRSDDWKAEIVCELDLTYHNHNVATHKTDVEAVLPYFIAMAQKFGATQMTVVADGEQRAKGVALGFLPDQQSWDEIRFLLANKADMMVGVEFPATMEKIRDACNNPDPKAIRTLASIKSQELFVGRRDGKLNIGRTLVEDPGLPLNIWYWI